MEIWLPPSEGKNPPGEGPSLNLSALSFPSLTDTRKEIIDACAQITDEEQAQKTFNASFRHSAEIEANQTLMSQACAQASEVFNGVLFDALSAQEPRAWTGEGSQHITIFSGLFGALKPTDLIPLHRLAMGTKLPTLGNVTTLWKPVLGSALAEDHSEKLILDCRSSDYRQACLAPWAHLWEVRVERLRNGKRSVVSHNAKKWRGMLSGALALRCSGIENTSDLEDALAEVTPTLRSCDARGTISHVREIEISPAKTTSQGGSTRTLTLVTVED